MAGKRINMVGKSSKRKKRKSVKKGGSQSTRYHRPGQEFKRAWKKKGKWA